MLFYVTLIGLCIHMSGQEKDNRIVFDKTTHDYGTIARKSDGSCVFHFTNISKEPLVLSNVTTSCGCTVPSWTKTPVMPGGSGEIRIVYNTRIIGPFNKTITATFSNPGQEVQLTIKGSVAK